jgi:sporulation protein YlmC with PRC-barrel domain
MRGQLKYAALAAAIALTWGTASAQVSTPAERTDEFSRSLRYGEYLKGADLRASEIVGARVRNAQGDNLGEIEELVIPSGDEDDMLVIVSVGGVLDIGDKLVALPYKDLRVSADGDTFYFDRTEAQLEQAPAYTYDAQAEAQVRSQRPVDRSTQAPAASAARADSDRSTVRADDDRTAVRTDNGRTAVRAENDRPRATATAPRVAAAKSSNLALDVFDHRASDLIGASVLDDRGESVGKIDDIVVSTEDAKLHVVLAIGGFVGFGEKLISLPLDDLQITSDGDGDPQVRIAMTGEQLQQLAESRPDFRYERQVASAPAGSPRG